MRQHGGVCTWPLYNALHALCKKTKLAKTLQDALLQAAIAQPRCSEYPPLPRPPTPHRPPLSLSTEYRFTMVLQVP